jgi:DedD protein
VSDEGFREIQLNGKQLIFLFMAVTVVSVVIFLFGVLVGRGVREGAEPSDIAGGQVTPDPGAARDPDSAAPPMPAATSEAQPPAPPPAEELSYAERLLRDTPAEENLKTSATSGTAAPAPVVQEPVADKAPAPPPAATPKTTTPAPIGPAQRGVQATSVPAPVPVAGASAPASDPAGPGFAVQVAAYKDREDADRLAKQLSAKGYPAFVMDPVKGTSTVMFRVRVGKYKTRKDAEAVEARLQTAEQLSNAWIAR